MQEIHILDIRKLTEIVKTKYSYDFSNYAISSFKRRILRVLELYKIKSVVELTKMISADPKFFEMFVSEITVMLPKCFATLRFGGFYAIKSFQIFF